MVGRGDDALYSRMKQRELDGNEAMWEPIFMEDAGATMGLNEQRNKVDQPSV